MDWLLDTGPFITRNHCGRGWSENLILIYQLANLMVALAYFSIPLSLFALFRQIRGQVKEAWVLVMFVTFIVACGLTHMCDVAAFTWAPYRLFTFVDLVTAFASLPTALLLPRVIAGLIPNSPAPAGSSPEE